jgi:hypothetical protein
VTAHPDRETTELPNQTNASGQWFVPLQHLATQVDDLPYRQSWEHRFDEPQLLQHENECLLCQKSTTERQEHQMLFQFLGQQKMHCAHHERYEPQWRRSSPRQLQVECSGYREQPLHGAPLDAPIRRPMLR